MDATETSKDIHQYVVDASGKKTHILLSIEEYEDLLEEAWHRRVIAERRGGETIPLDDMKQRLGLE
jgi:hypothetical protein